jgi:hypothetical protein
VQSKYDSEIGRLRMDMTELNNGDFGLFMFMKKILAMKDEKLNKRTWYVEVVQGKWMRYYDSKSSKYCFARDVEEKEILKWDPVK